jgi:hypothetical protein
LLVEALFHAGGGDAMDHVSEGLASEPSPVRSGAPTAAARLAALGGQAVLWSVLGLVFGALVEASARRVHSTQLR